MELKARMDAATSGRKREMLGVIVVAVDSKDNEIITHASGRTDLAPNAKLVDKSSIFRLASCTKLVTSIAILRLLSLPPFDSKNIQSWLEDPTLVTTHLSELAALEIITSPSNSKAFTYRPRMRPLTIQQLLTHTSGVGYDMIDPRLRAWRKQRGERTMTLHGPLPEAVCTPLVFEPGEGWAYGGGLDWVGVFVERVSGVKFGKWLKENVFNVVGCDGGIGFSRQEVERSEDGEDREVVLVVTKGKDRQLKENRVKEQEDGIERGGGGLFSSASNFIKILADIISPTPTLLDAKVANLLFAPQLLSSSKSLSAFQSAAPMFRGMSGPLTPTNNAHGNINHALGGMLVTRDNTEGLGKTKGTMTWGGAFNCMWFANREVGVAGFYGSSMFPPGEKKSVELMGEFLKEVWATVG